MSLGDFYATASQVLTTTCRYNLYRKLNELNLNYTNVNKVMDGMLSGVATSLITHPIDWKK